MSYQTGSTDLSATQLYVSGTGTYDRSAGEWVAPNNLRLDFTGGASVVVGLWWKCPRPRASDEILRLHAGSTQVLSLVRSGVTSVVPDLGAGCMALTHENGTLYEPASTTPVLSENVRYWIVVAIRAVGAGSTLAVYVADATGALIARTALSQTLTLPARTIDSLRITSPRARLAGFYVRSGAAASNADDRWREPQKAYLPLSQPGDYAVASNWEEPSTSGGTALIGALDETNEDADASYARNQTAPTAVAADRFSGRLAAVPRQADTILGARFDAACRLAYGTSATHRIALSQGLTDSFGSTVSQTGNYGYQGSRTLEVSPFTSAAFTPAELAAIDVGVDLVTLA